MSTPLERLKLISNSCYAMQLIRPEDLILALEALDAAVAYWDVVGGAKDGTEAFLPFHFALEALTSQDT